jgi:hypothetical protein
MTAFMEHVTQKKIMLSLRNIESYHNREHIMSGTNSTHNLHE